MLLQLPKVVINVDLILVNIALNGPKVLHRLHKMLLGPFVVLFIRLKMILQLVEHLLKVLVQKEQLIDNRFMDIG